jgi:5-methylcytosine-specific restriction endonuclease McrA
MICTECNIKFSSKSNYYIHSRENHTFNNCKLIECEFCNKEFNSPIFNNKLNKYYLKCEYCRNIQKLLNTNDLKSNTFVYNKKYRFFLNKGEYHKVCHVNNCNIFIKNDIKCDLHLNVETSLCKGTKCNNYFISNEFNFCNICRETNNKSKIKTRYSFYDLKVSLGGKCINCNCTDLFKLEFDHINPKIKNKQITRISKFDSKLDKEIENIQLLCGNCHRIKSFKEQQKQQEKSILKNKKCKDKKLQFTRSIKKDIGCQMCKWKPIDIESTYCLDFDHINTKDKYKNISDLYSYTIEILINEILKCRLLCRCYHQLHTCIQRGGKMLKIYYDDKTIKNFEKKFQNNDLNKIFQKEIEQVLIKYKNNIG